MNQQYNANRNSAIVKSAKIMHLCSAVIFLVAGLLLALVPDFEDSGTFRNTVVGIASIIIGATGIYGYFSNDMYRLAFQLDFALGIFNVIFGILLLINPVQLSVLLPTAVSILTLLDGGNKSQMAIEGKRFGIQKWYLVLVSAVLEIAAGVVLILLAYHGRDVRAWMGVAMGLVGVTNFWTTMYTVRVRNTTHHILLSQMGERSDTENKS
ncbi:MAG: DUF308 domain-containing protein [Ruminococcaceae bacterium]|nr:DUF308 domain-containing protein [Oscillospiraceae bacterium]